MMKISQLIGVDDKKRIPTSMLEAVISELNEPVKAVIDILRNMSKKLEKGNKNSSLSPKEVLATFDLASIEAMRQSLRHLGSSASDERGRESRGYYPQDPLPSSAASYLSNKASNALKNLKDERALHFGLAVVASLAGCSRNTDMMQTAVDKSLVLTEGKVTELTPSPIPEALAALYQENGDLESALHYYKLSLEGIRTFVTRQKADAIVLNACLVQATFNVREALRMAFEFSPFFSDNQQYGIVGPGRSLLIQQVEAWVAELGWKTLEEAREGIFATDEDADGQRGVPLKLSQVSNTTTESQQSTSSRRKSTVVSSRCTGNNRRSSKCVIM